MTTKVLLIFLPLLISSYNLDEAYFPYRYESSSSFGYSVGLYSEKYNSSVGFKSWLFVGDPTYKSGNETGLLFCAPQPLVNWVRIRPQGIMTTTINATSKKSLTRGWYGAAMDISEKDGAMTVCAPRTTLTYRSDGNVEDNIMQGVCYGGSVHSSSLEIKAFPTYKKNNNPMTGFAVHYPRSQIGLESVSPIVGSPMHENVGAVHKLEHQNWTTLEEYSGMYLPLFGYAISSGHYFNQSQLMVAGGAPGWNHVGQVAIMKYYQDNSTPFSVISKINGTELGEFFGSSLVTGDLNNDGLDDLIVGASQWNNNNGKVYIYLGKRSGFTEADNVLEGRVNDALFGYALTSGDFDNDGFDDVVVAAPWEGSGVIYVYYGDADLQVDVPMKLRQVIAVEGGKLFGYSLSNPVDIDANGFPDIAVGAYGDVTAGIVRSKPVVKIEITLATHPSILLRNSTSFVVEFCVRHDVEREVDGAMIFRIDEHYNRAIDTVFKYRLLKRPRLQYCDKIVVYLQNSRNHLADIEIFAEYQFDISDYECIKMTMWDNRMCPVKYRFQNPSNRTKVSYDFDCGDDRTCQASIIAKLEFQGISNSTYTIGSNDFNLVLMIKNDGEPAYFTTAIFYLPVGVFLKHLEPSCHEKKDQQSIMVKCHVGDPLKKDTQKTISLSLAMSNLWNVSLNETTLNFTAHIETRSPNQGQSNVTIPLKLEMDASISLHGNDYQKIRYFGTNNKPSTVNFNHNYQVSQFGTTPISKVLLKVLVPCKLGCFKFLRIAELPRVSLSDGFYECTLGDMFVSNDAIAADELLIKHTSSNQLESLLTSWQRSRTTHITKANANADQLQCENVQSQYNTESNLRNSNVINLNCSTPNVICEQVECKTLMRYRIIFYRSHNAASTKLSDGPLTYTKKNNWSAIAKGLDKYAPSEKICWENQLSEIPNRLDHTGERNIAIHFTTEAAVHVLNPITKFDVPGAGIFNTIPNDVKILKNEVGIPIILGSILLGFLLLGILALVLRHMGFFERRKMKKTTCDEMEMRYDDQAFK